SLPNFKALRAAWPHIAAAQGATDPMQSIEAVLGVVSVGSATAVTVDELAGALTPAEMPGLRGFIHALMVGVGLAGGGEADGPLEAAPASPSTATSTTSSAPSSPA